MGEFQSKTRTLLDQFGVGVCDSTIFIGDSNCLRNWHHARSGSHELELYLSTQTLLKIYQTSASRSADVTSQS